VNAGKYLPSVDPLEHFHVLDEVLLEVDPVIFLLPDNYIVILKNIFFKLSVCGSKEKLTYHFHGRRVKILILKPSNFVHLNCLSFLSQIQRYFAFTSTQIKLSKSLTFEQETISDPSCEKATWRTSSE
jgi:hypothetical protein